MELPMWALLPILVGGICLATWGFVSEYYRKKLADAQAELNESRRTIVPLIRTAIELIKELKQNTHSEKLYEIAKLENELERVEEELTVEPQPAEPPPQQTPPTTNTLAKQLADEVLKK